MSALVDEIRALRERYPERRSAVLPALHLAQEHHDGWLPSEAFREVAAALEVTPAYCYSIASFYDMFRLEPAARVTVEVCTNIPCAARGAQQVLEAFERDLGCAPGGQTADGAFALGTIECLGGCGWATVVTIDHHQRVGVQPDDVPGIVEELRRAEG
jgi:NADH-quinone oxidoreductase subunit E